MPGEEDTAPRSVDEPASEPVIVVPEETPANDVDVVVIAPSGDDDRIPALERRIIELENRVAAYEEYNGENDESGSGGIVSGNGGSDTGEFDAGRDSGTEPEERPSETHWWFRKRWFR